MVQVQRIMIIGGPGSGKTTLARRLGGLTGLPVVHLDKVSFRPGWVPVPREDLNAKAILAAHEEQWIIDGNSSETWPYRASRAHLILFLDLPRGARLRRIFWRTLTTLGRTRAGMAEGCPERFDRDVWISAREYDVEQRKKPLALIEDCRRRGRPRCVVLRSASAVEWFLREYQAQFSDGS